MGRFDITVDFSEIFARCQDRLFFYSPYRFIPGHDRQTIFERTVLSPLVDKISRGIIIVRTILIEDESHFVLIEPLAWDTDYFGFPLYKIVAVLYTHDNYLLLKKAMLQLTSEISSQEHTFYFLDIPSEDTYLIQAFCECGFRLTETRLHYTFSNIGSYFNERHQVRVATEHDIENLRFVAIEMRNPYDRIHADTAFSQERADAYLATYIENSVRGFSDLVLVPAEGDGPPDGFHTSSFPVTILDKRVAKFGAVALSRKTRKGWLKKMISETIYILKAKETDYILVDTQAPNKAVQIVFDSCGFKLAFITHIFSKYNSSICK